MKKLASIFVAVCFMAVVGIAQDAKPEPVKTPVKSEGHWHGYVVDAMCATGMMKKGDAMMKAAKHTKECALEEACASSGFGVFSEGKFYKFDESGDAKAKELIEKSSVEKGLMVDVTGTMDGEKIMVASIAEMKMEKKNKKVDEMKKMKEDKQ